MIHLIDRSRVDTREACPRKRFLNYDYPVNGQPTGLQPEKPSLPLISGIAIHAAHARLLLGEPLEEVLTSTLGQYREELTTHGLAGLDVTQDVVLQQSMLLEGMLRLWALRRLPVLLRDFRVVSVEQGWRYELAPGLQQTLRLDALLQRYDDGLYFVKDFKTVKYPSEVWAAKFEHNLQTCLYVQAVKDRLPGLTGDPAAQFGGILYEGLVKGAFKTDTAKSSPWYGQRIQHSPYTLAYALTGEDGLTVYQTAYTSKKGWRKVRPYDHMSMKDWVENHLQWDEQTCQELFIDVPDICPPTYELERAKRQVVREELQYLKQRDTFLEMSPDASGAEEYLDLFAPLRTDTCSKYGQEYACPFMSVCFNQGARPLEDGGFVPRVPHHDTDLKVIAE